MRVFFLTLLVLLFVNSSNAQSITGTVIDSDKVPAEYATVRIFDALDSSVVSGAYVNEKGGFNVNDLKAGNYYLKISFAGHEVSVVNDITILSPLTKLKLESITLSKDKSLALEEVNVTGSLDALKSGIDKKIYSVEQDISVRGGTANDVLSNIPSIEVDQDGNISLRGDGNVTILINGRPSTMAAGDGQNLLDALPANSIERIEVVTNPSAKYDPDGTSGIINIVMKKNRLKGFNGVISGTAATGNLYDVNLGLSYRTSKMNLLLNYSMNYYEGFRNNYSDVYQQYGADSSVHLQQNREGTDQRLTNTLVLGSDFYLSKRTVLGLSLTGSVGGRERTGELESRLFDEEEELFRLWSRNSLDPRNTKNGDVNVNLKHDFKEEVGSWSFNGNQSFGDRDVEGFYTETNLTLEGMPDGTPLLEQRLRNQSTNSISTLQTDMDYVFKKMKARMEAGAKAIIRTDIQSTYSEAKDVSGIYMEDTLANFDYNYGEQIYSIYGIFGQELGKFKYQGGLRGEYAVQIPELVSKNEVFRNDYLNVFPSAHIKYVPTKKSEFSLSYSRRINRAKSRQLNPFASYANPLSIRRGNPELMPEYIDSYDFGYSLSKKKVILSASVFHRRTRDVINRVKEYFPDNSSVVTYANIDKSVSTGFEAVIIYKPVKRWKNTLSFNGNYIDYTNTDTTVDWTNDGYNWGVKYISNVDFWKNTASAQLNLRYNAPRVTPQGIVQPRAGVSISVEKRLLDKKLTIGMRVTDVFNQQGFELDLETENARQIAEYKWLTRRFYITASYKFGKLDKKLRAPRRTSGGGGID